MQAVSYTHLPMPIVIRTRNYDDESFRKSMGFVDDDTKREMLEKEMESDF